MSPQHKEAVSPGAFTWGNDTWRREMPTPSSEGVNKQLTWETSFTETVSHSLKPLDSAYFQKSTFLWPLSIYLQSFLIPFLDDYFLQYIH